MWHFMEQLRALLYTSLVYITHCWVCIQKNTQNILQYISLNYLTIPKGYISEMAFGDGIDGRIFEFLGLGLCSSEGLYFLALKEHTSSLAYVLIIKCKIIIHQYYIFIESSVFLLALYPYFPVLNLSNS